MGHCRTGGQPSGAACSCMQKNTGGKDLPEDRQSGPSQAEQTSRRQSTVAAIQRLVFRTPLLSACDACSCTCLYSMQEPAAASPRSHRTRSRCEGTGPRGGSGQSRVHCPEGTSRKVAINGGSQEPRLTEHPDSEAAVLDCHLSEVSVWQFEREFGVSVRCPH